MRRRIEGTVGWALLLALAVACGGESTDSGGGGTGGSSGAAGAAAGGGTGGTAGSAGTGGAHDASVDAPDDDAAPDASTDASPWAICFGEDGQDPISYELKICPPNDGQCEIRKHRIDCCGNFVYYGVAVGKTDLFDECEEAWRAQLGECYCPQGPGVTEQPAVPVEDDADVEVACVNCTMDSCLCLTSPVQ